MNRQRRTVEGAILDQAMRQAEVQLAAGHAVLLLSGGDWHPGVVGIVAGRVRERFNRPSLVAAALEDGTVKGSARSVEGLDIGAAIIMARQSGLLLTGGGHAMAGGFSLDASGLPAFHRHLDDRLAAARLLPPAQALLVDGVLAVPAATVALATEIGRLAPFGPGNPEPLFALPRVRVLRADRVGARGQHAAADPGGRGRRLTTEGAAVPRRRRPAGHGIGAARRPAAASGRLAARRELEQRGERRLLHPGRRPGGAVTRASLDPPWGLGYAVAPAERARSGPVLFV